MNNRSFLFITHNKGETKQPHSPHPILDDKFKVCVITDSVITEEQLTLVVSEMPIRDKQQKISKAPYPPPLLEAFFQNKSLKLVFFHN